MKHFKLNEFQCSCCGEINMDSEFLERLDCAREIAGTPFIINSGYRCSNKQDALKEEGHETAEGTSPHQKGVAADIFIYSPERRLQIIKALIEVGFTRIGFAKNFVHVDSDPGRKENWMWLYKNQLQWNK